MSDEEKVENIDEELRQREIKRLTSPLNYPKGIFGGRPTDIEGNPVNKDHMTGKITLEPKRGILTDDEILKYAGESKTASRIRLKRGIGSFSDKTKLHRNKLLVIWFCLGFYVSLVGGILIAFSISIVAALFTLIFSLGIPTIITIYVYYLKNYKENVPEKQITDKKEDDSKPESNKTSFPKDTSFSTNIPSLKTYEKQIQGLESLYKIKEKLALELIEKRFTPPQLTYDRFIGIIASCNQIFYKQAESALNIIKVATNWNEKVENELEKRINTLKSIIEKIDILTNELAINLSSSDNESSDEVKDLLDDMQILADSVKEYE